MTCIDLHPTEPRMLVSGFNLSSGQVDLLNYQNQELIKKFQVSSSHVLVGKSVARKSLLINNNQIINNCF